MRVAVCCKGVPVDPDLEAIQVTGGDIRFGRAAFHINEFDAYALETAMALKEKHSAETFAVSLGPLRVQDILYYASARGIDHIIRVDGETAHPELVALGLIPPLREIRPDLILTGVQSEDWMGGEVGVYLSQGLNMSFTYAVTEVSKIDGENVYVKKEVGGGRSARVRLGIPAVLCIQSGIYPLSYVSRRKILKSARNPIKGGHVFDREEAIKAMPTMTEWRINEVISPAKERRAEILTGNRKEVAEKVVEIIEKAL